LEEDQLFILVIEDDVPIQVVVEDALTDGGFEPAIAPSGEEAVTLLKGMPNSYCALVTDISSGARWMDGKSPGKPERSTRIFLSSTSPLHMPINGLHRAFPTVSF
jgi:hypothetical protein